MTSTTAHKVVKVGEDIELRLDVTTPSDKLLADAPTFFFIHIWGGSSSTYSSVIKALAPFFPTVALNLRGWGGSSGPDGAGAYKISDFASDVEFVIKTLGLKSVILVGHSMGGKVAQAVAGRHTLPDGILKGLALLAPALPGPMSFPTPSMRDQLLHAFDNADNAEAVIRAILIAPENLISNDELVSATIDTALRGNRWAKAAWPSYGMAEDITELFSRIDLDVLVVAGEKDMVEPPDKMKTEIADKLNTRPIGTTSMVVIEGSGHLLPAEKPDEVAQALKRFAEQV
ncbi:Alpha/Beta hydrolase protein [Xylariales sp. PMI_506]|nr:Alpha/Beta hydrolase protein [Xylariales sp. PMI_506]